MIYSPQTNLKETSLVNEYCRFLSQHSHQAMANFKKQESHRAYGMAVSRVVVHRIKLNHCPMGEGGQLVSHALISFAWWMLCHAH